MDERAEARRQAIHLAATDRKTQLHAAAAGAADALQATAHEERERALAAVIGAIEQVHLSFTTARDGIDTQRRASHDGVISTARTRREELDQIIKTKKQELTDTAQEKAQAALRAGTDEGSRAQRESTIKAGRARQLGETKAARYHSYDRANRIASAAREMVGTAAEQMEKEGREVSTAVHKDSLDLAEKFRREAREGVARFDEARSTARKKIDEEESKAVEGIGKSADDAITGLRGQSDRLVGQLQGIRDSIDGELAQLGGAAAASMAIQGEKAEGAIDAQTSQADGAIGQFTADVARQLPGVAPAALGQVVEEVDVQLGAAIGDFDAQQASQVADTTSAFQGAADAGQSRLSLGVTELLNPLLESARMFERSAADTELSTKTAISQLASAATGGMEKATTDVGMKLGQAVTDSESRWGTQLHEGRAQMTGKVDEALTAQERALVDLGGKIDEKAEEIEHESWWERGFRFIGGVIVGLFEELWDLVKGLLLVLLVILVIVVVIAAIVVLILALVEGAAGIAAAVAFLAAVVAVAKVILVVLAVVGIAVMVGVVAWRLYQAWSRDDLSDYERGKLVGRSITDVLSVLVPGRALARLRGWMRLRQLARLVGGEARLAALLSWAGGDLVALERLAGDLRSVDELEVALTRSTSLEEFLQLRRLCNNDLPLTMRMLGRAPASDLIPAIAEFGNDTALLDRLLTDLGSVAEARRVLGMVGDDLVRLRRWVEFFDGARPMEAMFVEIGRDATLLDDLVTNTANRAELTRFLARLGGNAPLLRDLMLATENAPQLDNMLAMMANDGVELRRLLTLAGGRPAAASAEQLMILARAEGRSAANIERLVTQAGGNPAELGRLLRVARQFAGRQRVPTTTVPAPGYSGARIDHAVSGHTYAFFDFARLTPQGKTMWPASGAGNELAQVEADMQAACTALQTPGGTVIRVQGGAAGVTPITVTPPAVAPGAGQIRGPVIVGQFQFGTRGGAPPFEVFQFFPRPGAGFEHHSEALLRAIEQIMAVL